MNEAHVTVMGNVATQIDFRTSASGVPVARFRLASTVRRFDQRTAGWSDAFTSFYTVWARRALASNVASSVSLGEPVIVAGQLRVQETERDGRRFVSADLMASGIGHDLSRGTSAFVRVAAARAGLVDAAGDNGTAFTGTSETVHGAPTEAGIPGQAPAP